MRTQKEKTIHKKVRKEFELSRGQYYYLSFEGNYISEIVEFVEEEASKQHEKKILKIIDNQIEEIKKANTDLLKEKDVLKDDDAFQENLKQSSQYIILNILKQKFIKEGVEKNGKI